MSNFFLQVDDAGTGAALAAAAPAGAAHAAVAAYAQQQRPWFFSWTFCVAACTIASGCLAERTRLVVYPAFTLTLAALVHPLLVHWLWAPGGWMGRVSRCPPLDFAGGTVVHMAGGLFGLVGAALVGPRLGRFEGLGRARAVKEMPGHDMGWVTIGTLALWFGWYGFNSGSVFAYRAPSPAAAQRAAMNTTLGASGSGLVALLLGSWLGGTYDLRLCCNGVLSGLVTVTAMCGFVDPYAAAVGGAIAGAAYIGFSRLMVRHARARTAGRWRPLYRLLFCLSAFFNCGCRCLLLGCTAAAPVRNTHPKRTTTATTIITIQQLRCGVDDPLDSGAVHFGNGLLGTLMLAFFAKPSHVAALTGAEGCGGLFYAAPRTGALQLGMQLLGEC